MTTSPPTNEQGTDWTRAAQALSETGVSGEAFRRGCEALAAGLRTRTAWPNETRTFRLADIAYEFDAKDLEDLRVQELPRHTIAAAQRRHDEAVARFLGIDNTRLHVACECGRQGCPYGPDHF